ncbi:MAG: hypothetical protein JSW07_13810 [bacterium]|nr:MAG: hypothetical protein JSW07_13810 [bacterium]
MTTKSIEQVLKDRTPKLMSMPEVVGTAQGLCNGKPCIKVFVEKMNQQVKAQIPNTIEGFDVKVEVTGMFRAL